MLSRKNDKPAAGKRINAIAAGYMELEGATKDAECLIVDVKNGVSSERGCCNLFDPTKGTTSFRCGTCEYLTASGPRKG